MKNGDKPAHPAELAFHDGQALDSNQTGDRTGIFPGLTKREYFAAMALQGMCTNYFNTGLHKQANTSGATIDLAIAVAAVIVADELLKQLES